MFAFIEGLIFIAILAVGLATSGPRRFAVGSAEERGSGTTCRKRL
jgi:hypothetical protein